MSEPEIHPGREPAIRVSAMPADTNAHAVRDVWLREQGFRILHFWNSDILINIEGVAASVLAALETPLPDPLPQGERGNMEHNNG